jgi:hypothetical protein
LAVCGDPDGLFLDEPTVGIDVELLLISRCVMMPARPFRQENAMSEFRECLLIVTAEVDAAVETEWNRWYDTFTC